MVDLVLEAVCDFVGERQEGPVSADEDGHASICGGRVHVPVEDVHDPDFFLTVPVPFDAAVHHREDPIADLRVRGALHAWVEAAYGAQRLCEDVFGVVEREQASTNTLLGTSHHTRRRSRIT